jgi:hypothetical protein
MPRALRSVLAVLAGFVLMVAIVIACTHALRLNAIQPTPGYLKINFACTMLAALAAGWLTARLAGYRPMAHGLALAMTMVLLGMVALMKPTPTQPWSYQFLLAAVPPFAVLLGSWIAARRMAKDRL